jgi:glycosyltransferase involved in cell wall biosynthesis
MRLSAIIIAKNEEKNIAQCIQSVKFCDEIIVIDDNSIDKTAAIAKKSGAIVIEHALNEIFSEQRNFGMNKATGDWILFIDADERINDKLKKEILNSINNKQNISGFYLARHDFVFGKFLKHGETSRIELLRLSKQGAGIWKGKVHEVWITSQKTEVLNNPLLHYPHVTVSDFLKDINFYSTLRAQELFEEKKHVFWVSIIVYPKAKFMRNYIVRLGFLDGVPGFIMAAMMSFHSFLVRAKLWLLWEKSSHQK